MIALMLASVPVSVSAAPPSGIWTNPRHSVHVVFQRCGHALCGKVVWASAQADADAARGGGGPLVGTMLFRDFVEDAPGSWSGSVLIPDIGQTVSGTITQVDANTLRGEGCLIAGFGCKSQTWTRVR